MFWHPGDRLPIQCPGSWFPTCVDLLKANAHIIAFPPRTDQMNTQQSTIVNPFGSSSLGNSLVTKSCICKTKTTGDRLPTHNAVAGSWFTHTDLVKANSVAGSWFPHIAACGTLLFMLTSNTKLFRQRLSRWTCFVLCPPMVS